MFHHSRVQFFFLTAVVVVVTACEQPTSSDAVTSQRHDGASSPEEDVAVGDPLRDLSSFERRLFFKGSAVFQTEFTPATGLGPLFNAVGCAACHESPVVGGAGSNVPEAEEGEVGEEDVVSHATAFRGGVCRDLVGGPVIQVNATPALQALGVFTEPVPAGATGVGRRTTPSLLGFGLLDAVTEDEILSHADPHDRDHDGISGRANRAPDGHVGRFGRKAQTPRLSDFNAEAFVMEVGITNPDNRFEQLIAGRPFPAGVDPTREPELAQEQVDAASAFVQFLAPPSRLRLNDQAERGQRVFSEVGCSDCHLPTLKTGPSRVRALSFEVVHAYTDLLLHDMGPTLADICRGLAEPAEFRTEPLMGVRFKTTFLHDGRAASLEDAIKQHAGEGTRAQRRFLQLDRRERAALLEFLSKL